MEYIIILVLFVGVMFLMSRGQRKQQKKAAEFRDSLEVGTLVMTASGCVGTIAAIDGDLVTLENEDGSSTRWIKAAISKPYEVPATTEAPIPGLITESEPKGFAVPDDVSALIEKPESNEDPKN